MLCVRYYATIQPRVSPTPSLPAPWHGLPPCGCVSPPWPWPRQVKRLGTWTEPQASRGGEGRVRAVVIGSRAAPSLAAEAPPWVTEVRGVAGGGGRGRGRGGTPLGVPGGGEGPQGGGPAPREGLRWGRGRKEPVVHDRHPRLIAPTSSLPSPLHHPPTPAGGVARRRARRSCGTGRPQCQPAARRGWGAHAHRHAVAGAARHGQDAHAAGARRGAGGRAARRSWWWWW